MHGVKRVIAFCILTAVLPASLIILPLYLRHTVFADVTYRIAESDIIEIRDGISSVFCQQHSLQMDTSFNAFQMDHEPEVSKMRKHIRLKKSMSLPDDTLEYWGFYLLKGATVALKVCSRYDGSRILVVKGERNLRTCGLLEHNNNKFDAQLNNRHGQVQVTFESAAELIVSSNQRTNRNESSLRYTSPDAGNHGGEDLTDENLTQEESAKLLERIRTSKEKLSVSSKTPSTARRTSIRSTSTDTAPHSNRQPAAPTSEVKHHRKRHNHNKTGHRDTPSAANATGQQQWQRRRRRRNVGRKKRDQVYDRAINHGGNAMNHSSNTSDSVSSFETSLLTCYDGDILLAQSFPPSTLCQDVRYLENGVHMITKHEVTSDGYYYYIFYSDNDYVMNDIHAMFDIYKPTFQYSNLSESQECINSTHCTFPIKFWSSERVIVEVPTRDGIEHEEDDITLLVSTCHPRMAIYIIFPVSVLFFVLTCAFL